MRLSLLLLALIILPACSLFHKTPSEVVQAADYTSKFAAANENNLKVMNDQYYKAWKKWMEEHGGTGVDLEDLKRLHDKLTKMTEEAADYCTLLSKAVADYLKEPSADYKKLIPILEALKGTL
jgi:hypothetical protein